MILNLISIIYTILISNVESGLISRDSPNPIILYRNNEKAWTNITFYVSFETQIYQDAEILVLFPPEFLNTQLALAQNSEMSSADPCPIIIQQRGGAIICPTYNPVNAENQLLIFLGSTSISAGSYTILIKYNVNPTGYGGKGTGYFRIRSLKKGVLVDNNEYFGTIGFAPAMIIHLSASATMLLSLDGANLGGYTTNLVFQFTTTKVMPAGTWFRIIFPNSFIITGVSCFFSDAAAIIQFNIQCQNVYQTLISEQSLTESYPIGTYTIKIKNVVNPFSAGTKQGFYIEYLQPWVKTVIEQYQMNSISITPGSIINCAVSANPLNQNLRVDYEITFTPMNRISVNGLIKYTFPAGSGYILASTCRIISGLSGINGNPVTCISQGLNIYMYNFADFTSQPIVIKIYATNPGISALYSPFQVFSYSTFNSALPPATTVGKVTTINWANLQNLDQNLNAGSIQISSIQSPYYVQVDLYTAMVNATLNSIAPLDFRLYPSPGKNLQFTKTDLSVRSEIFFQLPMWWRNQGQSFDGTFIEGAEAAVLFGVDPTVKNPSTTVIYNLQKYNFNTPSSSYAVKYLPNMGLGNCDLPISIQNVQLPPIPGRWDFRALTIQGDTYRNFATNPLEQDLYTMEIATSPWPWATMTATSNDQVDEDNIIYFSLTVGFNIPYEGVINLNMSTVNNTYAVSAAWPNDLGQGIGNNAFIKIPCSVYVNGQLQGTQGSIHPNLRCYVFSGGATRLYSIIQVRGFSSTVSGGSNVFAVFPNIRTCTKYGLNCFITLSSSYTAELDNPYTMNTQVFSTGTTQQGTAVNYYTSVNDTTPIAATFPAAPYAYICDYTTWTFKFALTASSIPKHFLIKFPRFMWKYSLYPFGNPLYKIQYIFDRTGVQSNAGTVYIIENFITDEVYYFIIQNNVGWAPVANVATVTLFQIRNPTVPNPGLLYSPTITGIVTKLIYWGTTNLNSNPGKLRKSTFPNSATWNDEGILYPTYQVLPNQNYQPAQRSSATDMDFLSTIYFAYSFTTCKVVNQGGSIFLQVQEGLSSLSPTCQIWSGIEGTPSGLGTVVTCAVTTGTPDWQTPVVSNNFYQIQNFFPIAPLTKIGVSFSGQTGSSSVPTVQPVTIGTFDNNAAPVGNTIPYALQTNIKKTITAYPLTGPKTYPLQLQFNAFENINVQARIGFGGEFYFTINYPNQLNRYNPANPSNMYLTFTFENDALNRVPLTIPNGYGTSQLLHCRIDGQLSGQCLWSGGATSSTVTMYMPLNMDFTANVPHLVSITTRGADYSSSGNEGLRFLNPGTFQVKVATNTGTPAIDRYNILLYTIPPTAFQNFWVWSASKVSNDWQDMSGSNKGTKTHFRVFFTTPWNVTIPESNTVTNSRMVLQFERVNFPTFTNGFQQDIGTGLPIRTNLPCLGVGFGLNTVGATKLICSLFYGTYPNPTLVIITNFSQINPGTACQIHLPNVFNPNSTLELTKVRLRAEQTSIIGGLQFILPILEANYDLINMTFGKLDWTNKVRLTAAQYANNMTHDHIKVYWGLDMTATENVKAFFIAGTANIDDATNPITIYYISKNYNLGGGADCIVFEFNPLWILPEGFISCSFGANTNCYSYPYASLVVLYLDVPVSKLTLVKGTIALRTPPFKIIVATQEPPINVYVYTRSKLAEVWTLVFQQSLSAVTVSPTVTVVNAAPGATTDYILTVKNTKNLRQGGVITIQPPAELTIKETGCRNNVIGGSDIGRTGFVCTVTGGIFTITGFPSFVENQMMIIQMRMLNCATVGCVTGTWSFNTWYLLENPLNKLITTGTAASPALAVATNLVYWDTPYLSRRRARENDIACPIEILLQVEGTTLDPAQPATDYITVTLPSQVTLAPYSQAFAIWDNTPWYDNYNDNWEQASEVQYNPVANSFQIYPPYGIILQPLTTYRLILSSLDQSEGWNGFVMPTSYQSANFKLTIQLDKNGFKQLSNPFFFIPYAKKFTYFESICVVQNAGMKNVFNLLFQPSIVVPSGGSLILFVPTVNEKNLPLFSNDLGTGLTNGSPINCQTHATWGAIIVQCNLYLGIQAAGVPAKIKVTGDWGSLSTGIQYMLTIDQIVNPPLTTDDRHVEMRLDSYDNLGNIINQGLSYDFSFKIYTPPIKTGLTFTPSTIYLKDQGVAYDTFGYSPVSLSASEFYDYFIIEFTKPVFDTQPTGISCTYMTTPAPICNLTKGHNWIIMKFPTGSSPLFTTNAAIKLANVANPQYLPTTGVTIEGYAIRDRVVVGVCQYTPVTIYKANTISGSAFVITNLDYFTGLVPTSVFTRYRIQIQVPTASAGLFPTSVLQIIAPTGFTIYPNCVNSQETLYTSQMQVEAGRDYFGCSVTGQILSITNMATLTVNSIIYLIVSVLTPSAAQNPSTWKLKAFKTNALNIELFNGEQNGPIVSSVKSFYEVKFDHDARQVIRQGNTAPFQIAFSVENDIPKLTVVKFGFPSASAIAIPVGANLICQFLVNNGATQLMADYCILTSPQPAGYLEFSFVLDEQLLKGQYFSATFTSQGAQQSGLYFGQSGFFEGYVSSGTNVKGIYFYEVLPTLSFRSPLIRFFNQQQGALTDIYVSFQVQVQVPENGRIVLCFPLRSPDGTVQYFNKNLQSSFTETSWGTPVGCVSNNAILRYNQGNFNCKLYFNVGVNSEINIVVSGFNSALTINTQITIIFQSISFITYANNGLGQNIDIQLYTANMYGVKIETLVLFDYIAPFFTGAVTSYTFSPSILKSGPSLSVHSANQRFNFGGINIGTNQYITPKSMIIFQFPSDNYRFSTAQIVTGGANTSPNCDTNVAVETVENYIIYRQTIQPSTACEGSSNIFTFGNLNSAIYEAAASEPVKISICHDRVCQGTGTAQLTQYNFIRMDSDNSQSFTNVGVVGFYSNPLAFVNLAVTYTIPYMLVANTVIQFKSYQNGFQIKRMTFTGGIGDFEVAIQATDANYAYFQIKLLQDRPSSANIVINLFGIIPSNFGNTPSGSSLFQIGVVAYYNDVPAKKIIDYYISANAPWNGNFISIPPPGSFATTVTIDKTLNVLTLIPNVGGQRDILLSIDTTGITSEAGDIYQVWVYTNLGAEFVNQAPTACLFPLSTPISDYNAQCNLDNNLKGIYNTIIYPQVLSTSQVLMQIQTMQPLKNGYFNVNAVIKKQPGGTGSPVDVAYYYGMLLVNMYLPNTFSCTFDINESLQIMYDNAATITFQPTLNSEAGGMLFFDFKDEVETAFTVQRNIQCSLSGNPYTYCLMQPSFSVSKATAGTYYDKNQFVSTRIQVLNITSLLTTTTYTLRLHLNIMYQQTGMVSTTKYFEFGYVYPGSGNVYNYPWVQYFTHNFVAANQGSSWSGTNSVTLSATATPQENSQSVTINNYSGYQSGTSYLKLKKGWLIYYDTNNLAVGTTSDYNEAGSTLRISGNPTCNIDSIQTFTCNKFDTNGGFFTSTLSSFRMPSYSLKGEAMYQMSINGQNSASEQIQFSTLLTQVWPAGSIKISQLSKLQTYIQINVPNQFQIKNSPNCISMSRDCPIQLQIIGFPSFDSLTIVEGIENHCLYLQNFNVPLQSTYDSATKTLTITRFRALYGNCQLGFLYLAQSSALTYTNQITFQVYNSFTLEILAEATLTPYTFYNTNVPTETAGLVQTQFGILEYQQKKFATSESSRLRFNFIIGSTAFTLPGVLSLQIVNNLLVTVPQTVLLRCLIRSYNQPYVAGFAPFNCTATKNGNNGIFMMQIASGQIPTAMTSTSRWELLIWNDNSVNPLINFPLVSGQIQFNLTFQSGTMQALGATSNIFTGIMDIYQNQLSNFVLTSFNNINSKTNMFRFQFKTQQTNIAIIKVDFPLLTLLTSTTQTQLYNSKDLGTGLYHGQRISCFDKTNQHPNIKCQLFQGLNTLGTTQTALFSSYVLITGLNSYTTNQLFSIDIFKFYNPSVSYLFLPSKIQLTSYDGSSLEYFEIDRAYATSKAAAPTNTGVTVDSYSTNVCGTAVTVTLTVSGVNSLASYQTPRISIKLDNNLLTEAGTQAGWNGVSATVGGVAQVIDPYSSDEFIITMGAAVNGNVQIIISGLQLPTFVYPSTSQFNYNINVNVYQDYHAKLIQQKQTIAQQVTLNQAANQYISNVQEVISTNLISETNSFSLITFNVVKIVPKYTMLQFNPKANTYQYMASQSACFMMDSNNVIINTLCTYKTNVVGPKTYVQNVEVEAQVSIPLQTGVQLWIERTNPTSSGAETASQLVVYAYISGSTPPYINVYQSNTLQVQTYTAYSWFNASVIPILTNQTVAQTNEVGPLRFTFKPNDLTADITGMWNYVVLDFASTSNLKGYITLPQTPRLQVNCFFNNIAAFMCNHVQNGAFNQIQIYLPTTTKITKANFWTVVVQQWRVVPIGETNFLYAIKMSDIPANTKDRKVLINNPSQTTIQTVTKYLVPFNPRNSEVFTDYIVALQTSEQTNTIIRAHFQLSQQDLPAINSTNGDWSRIIISLATVDDMGLSQTQHPIDGGRFTESNEAIDCNCVSCGVPGVAASAIPTNGFNCYFYLGYPDVSAPIQIWMEPIQVVKNNSVIDISFPKIMLPSIKYTYVKGGAIVLAYQQNTLKNVSELLWNYVYYTIPTQPQQITGLVAPNFDSGANPAAGYVGDPNNVNWVVNNNYQNLLALPSHDRWVLTTNDVKMIFEQPGNPNNPFLKTTAANAQVIIYTLAKWVEFRPTAQFVQSATMTLNVFNLKNMPYTIPGGVNYVMNLFINLGWRYENVYNAKPVATPHPVVPAQSSIQPVPNFQIVSLPQQVSLSFLPFNKIPITGCIFIVLPAYAYTLTDNYCQVTSGLQNPSCDIIESGATAFTLKICSFEAAYYPYTITGTNTFTRNSIIVVYSIKNPPNQEASIPHQITVYWDQANNMGDIIDKENNFEIAPFHPINPAAILNVVLYSPIYNSPYTLCGGRTGPISITFKLRTDDLYYPNDYIQLQFWNAFYPPNGYYEILCYFSSPIAGMEFVYNIKSHRCDWSAANGGTLNVYIPEEVDILHNQQWVLTFSARAPNNLFGFTIASPSDYYWATFSTYKGGSTTYDKGWFEAQIPGCPFNQWGFGCQSVSWDASFPDTAVLGNPTWNILNFTANANSNNIAAGDPSLAVHSRMVFSFLTHNELYTVFPLDLSAMKPAGTDRMEISCNGINNGAVYPFLPQGNPYIQCMSIAASGNAWNNTPAYVVAKYYTQISASDWFHLQIAKIKNSNTVGTFAHINVQVQQIKFNGFFYPINNHYCWNIVPSFRNPPNPATTITASLTRNENRVNLQVPNTYFQLTTTQTFNYGDVAVFNYQWPYKLPLRTNCQQYRYQAYPGWTYMATTPHPFNLWMVLSQGYSAAGGVLTNVQDYGSFRNPPFIYDSNGNKSPVYLYIWISNTLRYNVTLPNQSPVLRPSYIVLQTTEAANPEQQYVKYHVGLFLQTVTNEMTQINLWAPNDFQDVTNCKINRGLWIPDNDNLANTISCTVTKNVNTVTDVVLPYQTTRITINNYAPYQGDGWIIIDFSLQNPATPSWTKPWASAQYQNPANLTLIVNQVPSGDFNSRTWSGFLASSTTIFNLFRVFRNTVSFENRRAHTSQFAEVHMRVIPRTAHPLTGPTSNTQIEIALPLAFDIPNGGTPECTVSHVYHENQGGQQCQFTSDRKIFVDTSTTYGLPTTCSLVIATTEGSIGGNGVQLPPTPGENQFETYISSVDNSFNPPQSLREYQNLEGSTNPVAINPTTDTNFMLASTIREVNENTVVRIRFTAIIDIPTGYASGEAVDSLNNPPVGYIQIWFNSLDKLQYGNSGFPLNLGFPLGKIGCQAFSQLIPNVNTNAGLQCSVTTSPQISIFYPVIVNITNFEYITSGQVIEVHLLNVLNGNNILNNGQVQITAFQQNADGSVINIIKPTSGFIPLLYNSLRINNNLAISPTCPTLPSLKITPVSTNQNYVGAAITIIVENLPINENTLFVTIQPGDMLFLTFPSSFQLPNDGRISASWDGYQLITTVYPSLGQIYFQFPENFEPQQNGLHTLKVYQMENAAYAFGGTYSIQYTMLRSNVRSTTCSITSIPAPLAAPPVTLQMTIDKPYKNYVDVNYTWNFAPNYLVPQGSTIKILLPTGLSPNPTLNYNNINSATPPAKCVLENESFLQNCVITPQSLSFTASENIVANQLLTVELTGAENPAFQGTAPESSYSITITHPNGFLINEGNFNKQTFFAQLPVAFLYMSITKTNNFKQVSADYTITIQSSSTVPALGYVKLYLPKEWSVILPANPTPTSLTGSWTFNQLTYTSSIDHTQPTYDILSFENNFAWPGKTSLTFTFLALINPTVSQTNIFQAKTFYDGLNLDATDPLDTSLQLNFENQAPTITLSSFTNSPINEGEMSTFNFALTPPSSIVEGSKLQFNFPSQYSNTIVPSGVAVNVTLTLASGKQIICEATTENKHLSINIPEAIAANSKFTVTMVGIPNINAFSGPATNPAQNIDILTLTPANKIQFYSPAAVTLTPKAPPLAMSFTKLQSTSTNLQVKASYTICVETNEAIPLNGAVNIDFPEQFPLPSPSYECETTTGHSNNLVPYGNTEGSPECTAINNLKRIVITGHLQAKVAGSIATLCYLIKNIENPSVSGESNDFEVGIVDYNKNSVVALTYGTLSANLTLNYQRQGLQIVVGSVPNLPRLTNSQNISITLQSLVSYNITLTPSCPGFNIQPSPITFYPGMGAVANFTISPENNNVAVGTYKIQWTKVEKNTPSKFSELPDTYFNYVASPQYQSLTCTIYPLVVRLPLLAKSLPITVTLSQAASQTLQVLYQTVNQPSAGLFIFTPENQVTFSPGETEQTLTFSTIHGAISGNIVFSLDSTYKSIYYIPNNVVVVEILQIDQTGPGIVQFYSTQIGINFMNFRVSTNKTCHMFYQIVAQGDPKPTMNYIQNFTKFSHSSAWQQFGNVNSAQSENSPNFVYNDIYIDFKGLTGSTPYSVNFFVQDLNGLNNGFTEQYNFTTLPAANPAQFSIQLSSDVSTSTLIKAFGLVTGLPANRFVVIANPPKISISSAPSDVQTILNNQVTTYTFQILPSETEGGLTPIQQVQQINENLSTVASQVPQVNQKLNLMNSAYEVTTLPQKFKMIPTIQSITQYSVIFTTQLLYNGMLFVVIIPSSSPRPAGLQIKNGFNATNYKLPKTQYFQAKFVYSEGYNGENQNLIATTTFSQLNDNTDYTIYAIGQNNQPVSPQLMDDSEIQAVTFKTKKEVIVIPVWYQHNI